MGSLVGWTLGRGGQGGLKEDVAQVLETMAKKEIRSGE